MYIPTLEGTIDRRLLVNYRVDPDYLQELLPDPFRPKRIHGMGIAGICLIRLTQLRPRALPALFGFSSENAAHRIAVEWEEHGQHREGVYIPRRGCSHRTWGINRPAISNPPLGCFSSVCSQDRPPHPEVKLHSRAAAGTFSNLPAT